MVKLLPVLRVGWLVVLAAAGVANLAYNAKNVAPVKPWLPSVMSGPVRQEHRLADLRNALAMRNITGKIGYIGDVASSHMETDDRGVEDYYLAQYTLAPWVLDTKADGYALAIANLASDRPERLSGQWQTVENFGDGVLLLRKGNR
jgi:hypothetical protein